MITLEKKANRYCVFCKGQQLGWLELYDNPKHTQNCYVRIDLNSLETNFSAELWAKLKTIVGRPLQVMVDSTNVAMTNFLAAGGFVCKRKCYEVDACEEDYIGGDGNTELYYCSVNNQEYEDCCRMMYLHYVNTHKEINPWTADYTAFRAELPKVAVYARSNNSIMSVAYIEDNEIAYVCSVSKQDFCIFAKTLIRSMFMEHDNIFFECDNCDWVAMTLRKLFINQDESSFCTYILEDDN